MRTIAQDQNGAVLDHAEHGYWMFPCRSRGKAPLTRRGFKDASRDERTILHWVDRLPGANWAAACEASGITTVDIDTKHGADPRELIPQLGLEGNVTVLTGEAPERSAEYPDSLSGERGAQVYFRGDRRTTQTSIRGVELRGVGAYVIVPPSVHPSGVPYLGELPPVGELAELPSAVIRILPGTSSGTVRSAQEWRELARDGVAQGSRNIRCAALCGHLLRRDVDPYVVLELLLAWNRQRNRPPLGDAEVARTVDSIARKQLAQWTS